MKKKMDVLVTGCICFVCCSMSAGPRIRTRRKRISRSITWERSWCRLNKPKVKEIAII